MLMIEKFVPWGCWVQALGVCIHMPRSGFQDSDNNSCRYSRDSIFLDATKAHWPRDRRS